MDKLLHCKQDVLILTVVSKNVDLDFEISNVYEELQEFLDKNPIAVEYILDIDKPGNLRAEKQEIERHKSVKV